MKDESQVLRIRVTLQEVEPPIWRLIEVPASYSFWDLHVAIQDAMGWLDCHIHRFDLLPRGKRPVHVGIPLRADEDPPLKGWQVPVSQYLAQPGDQAMYEYDFGDSWVHSVVLEGVQLADPKQDYPRCVDGARACPPEDVGGVDGYEEFFQAMLDEKHPEHESWMKWRGAPFDPEAFDPSQVEFEDPEIRWQIAFKTRK